MPHGKLLTLRQAAELLGITGKRPSEKLQRILWAKERSIGRPIMMRSGAGRGTRYAVTLLALRRYLPTFFHEASELRSELKQHLESMRREMRAIVERMDETESKIAAVSVAVRRLRP